MFHNAARGFINFFVAFRSKILAAPYFEFGADRFSVASAFCGRISSK